jgi:5-methylcytosine-specific restriction endonuclease McrA
MKIYDKEKRNKDKKKVYRDKNKEKINGLRKILKKEKKDKAMQFLGGKCVKCPTTESLEFDHIDPKEKSFNITTNLLKKDLEKELVKCQLLCYSCHKEKSNMEKRTAIHGSHAMYNGYKKCRCNLCVTFHREYDRKYKKGKN